MVRKNNKPYGKTIHIWEISIQTPTGFPYIEVVKPKVKNDYASNIQETKD